MTHASRFVMSLSIAFAVAACNDGGSVVDLDGTGGGDAGAGGGKSSEGGGIASRTDSVAFPAAFTSSVVSREDGGAAELSCVGTSRAPAGGEPIDVALRFVDSADHETQLAGQQISMFPFDAVVPGSCPDFYCVGATTNDQGIATITVPRGGWYGFEIAGNDNVVRSFQVHTLAPSGPDEEVQSIATTRDGLKLLATLARLPREQGASFMAGRVHDCAGIALENVLVSVVSPGGERMQPRAGRPADGEPGTVYFDGEDQPMPSPERAAGTGVNGRFAVGGLVPEPGLPYRIEAWAVTEAGRAPVRIACEAAVVLDDSITIVGMHPERDDYELDHPCRFP